VILDKQIHGREIKLRLLLTDACNRTCPFCLNDFQPRGHHYLPLQTALAAIAQYARIVASIAPLQVYFSGGEPTLHRYLPDLARVAKGLGARVTINTNGLFGDAVEQRLRGCYDELHFGVYEQDETLAARILRMGGSCQMVYPPANNALVQYYLQRGLYVKVFENFLEPRHEDYLAALARWAREAPGRISGRHTGTQENRGPGCDGCARKCITLRAAWVTPDGGISPCPQLKELRSYPRTAYEWRDALRRIVTFHAKEI
jgi:molybdenum cofactor biosynthesis enzyme MoaA